MKGRHRERNEATPPDELSPLRAGDVLCDRHRRECYQVAGVDKVGVALHQDGTDFYVPRSLFVSWYGRRLFLIAESRSIDPPEWCRQHRDDESETGFKSDPPNLAGTAD